MTAKAPLEGDRISRSAVLPDFIAPADKAFFVTPRWRVRVLVGDALVKVHEWIATPTAESAVEAVRAYGYTDAVRYEVEQVAEAQAQGNLFKEEQ